MQCRCRKLSERVLQKNLHTAFCKLRNGNRHCNGDGWFTLIEIEIGFHVTLTSIYFKSIIHIQSNCANNFYCSYWHSQGALVLRAERDGHTCAASGTVSARVITLKVRDFCTLVKEECDNNTNPLQACTGHTNAAHSFNKQQTKWAESKRTEEEEERFYSLLMLELNSHTKNNRSDWLDLFSHIVWSYKEGTVCSVLSGNVEGLLLHINTSYFMCTSLSTARRDQATAVEQR